MSAAIKKNKESISISPIIKAPLSQVSQLGKRLQKLSLSENLTTYIEYKNEINDIQAKINKIFINIP